MDFIVGLPASRGYTTIMVAVDRLSKYAHFAPLPQRFDALRVARLFIDTVVKHHGFPKTMVSDRDPIFLSDVWKDMLRLSGTTWHFSTACHPQSDGQTEVRNRGLEQYLRAFAADRPTKWTAFLPWAELALNCFHNESIGTSPFRALYGREPPPLVASQPSAGRIRHEPTVAALIEERATLLVELRKNLERSQQRMRTSANQHRREVQFEVGDRVLLKLQNYRQHSVAKPLSAKLARRFYGPFKVLEKVGPVAYRLQLPQGARIHDVFHVSLLRPFVEGGLSAAGVDLPEEFVGNHSVVRPVKILEKRTALKGGLPVEQALVQWYGEDDSLASWEPLEVIATRFPSLLEDKEPLIGEGVDTDTFVDSSQPTKDDVAEPREAEEQEESSEEERNEPRRTLRLRKKPAWFGDYVSS